MKKKKDCVTELHKYFTFEDLLGTKAGLRCVLSLEQKTLQSLHFCQSLFTDPLQGFSHSQKNCQKVLTTQQTGATVIMNAADWLALWVQ